MMGFILFIGWIVLAFVAAQYAKNKGVTYGGILFISLLLSPIIGFLVALVSKPDPHIIKKCKYCAESIKAQAKICKHCGKDQYAVTV